MAIKKTSSWRWATLHAFFYGLPFLLLVSNWEQWAVIVGTHLIIDRFRLAQYWVDFWGSGKRGWLPAKLGVGEIDAAPPFLGVWLLILIDNTMHLLVNFLTLAYI